MMVTPQNQMTPPSKKKVDVFKVGRIQGKFFKKDTLTSEQMNHHVHVVGASGFGKTVFLTQMIKNQIRQGKGLLFLDLKSDLETMTKFCNLAIEAGRRDDFQNFALSDAFVSQGYNLLGKTGTATQLRDRIMQSLTWSDEYYKSQASSFLLKVLIALVFLRDHKGLKLNLSHVLDACSSKDDLEKFGAQIPKDKENIKAPIEEAFWISQDKDHWASLQGLRTQLESIVLSDFGDLVASEREGIDLFETIRDGKLVFLYLDSRRYGETAKAIGRFILQDLKATSARIDAEVKKEDRKPFSVIVDEFADLAQEDFIGFLDRARSSKMSIVVAHQEISDLKRISPEFANRLTGNTSTLYAFLQKNPDSAEFISGIAGTRTVMKKTERYSRQFFLTLPTGETSVRETEEFAIHPNVVKSLRVGEAVVVKKYPKATAYKIRVDAKL